MALCTDINDLSADAIFAPFLEVISSQFTNGSITFIALSSITKFLDYHIVSKDSPSLQIAISNLALAITHCRFEATDQAEDDAVLLKILSIMEEIVCGIGSDLLNDESLCEIIETCLSMACQMRRGDLLRRSAEMTMIKLTEVVFKRLSEIEPEVVIDAKSVENSELQMLEPNKEVIESLVPGTTPLDQEQQHTTEFKEESHQVSETTHVIKPFTKYGLASIREYFRVLISIIDTANFHQYTDATRIMALHLINVGFEVAGTSITSHESLLNLTTDTLLKHLLQLIRIENLFLLQKALRVFNTVLYTTREHLKLHQEVFLTYILTCLSPINDISREDGVDGIFYDGIPSIPRVVIDASPYPQAATPVGGNHAPTESNDPSFVTLRSPDSRETMVEALTSLARMPSFFVDLFVNYDCDVDRADLCVDMISFLCRNAYPDSATWSTSSVPPLCLDAILSYLISLAQRLDPEIKNLDKAEEAKKTKATKRLVIEATEKFNNNPADGLAFLVKHKIIPDDKTSSAVKFLRHSGRINKKLLGEFLAKPKNKEYLDLFIEDFDFSHKTFDEAMRELFASFRLPGESQQIERIMEKFAEHYVSVEENTKDVADKDAAFILGYAVIMLNVDLHSPKVKNQMTIDQFKRNLRKTNNGQDFDPQYLENIYYTIKQREIIIPEEHDNEESFEQSWKDVMVKSQLAGKLKIYKDNTFDKDMFESTWQPVVTMLSYVFATATDETVFSRVVTGFDHVAKIATTYQIPGVLDQVTTALTKISTLSVGNLALPRSTIEVQMDKEKVVVSDLSIQFGQDFKAQLATVVMFKLLKNNLLSITDSWKDLLTVITNFYLYSLIPPLGTEKQNILGLSKLSPVKPAHIINQPRSGKDSGLFSTLSSYISGYADSVPEPTEEEIDATLSTIDCVNSCNIKDFVSSILTFPLDKTLMVLDSLAAIIPNIKGQAPGVRQNFYTSILFLLDFATILALESDNPEISRRVISILKDSLGEWEVEEKQFLFKIILYYLTILGNGTEELKPELDEALDLILEIKPIVLLPCLPPLVSVLISLADESAWSSPIVLHSAKYWTLLKLSASNRESTADVFNFMNDLVAHNKPAKVGLENLVPVLDILGEITSVGACGAQLEQDKAAIAFEFRKQYDHHTSIRKAKEVIASMELDVQRAVKSLDLIYKLDSVVEAAAKLDADAGVNWLDVWYPFVRAISQQCINPCRKIRQHAFTYYERVVLSPVVHSRDRFDWIGVFAQALFPLIDALLNPEVYDTDPSGMAHTRLNAASLLCKVFLQFIVRTSTSAASVEGDEKLGLWIKVLDTLDRLISSTGVSPVLASTARSNEGKALLDPSIDSSKESILGESVVESVKNLLLVMKASESEQDEDNSEESQRRREKFWKETWARVDVIMPGLRKDIEPEEVQPSPEIASTPTPVPDSVTPSPTASPPPSLASAE